MSFKLTALKPSASVSDINLFLSNINILGWRVHARIVEFNNNADRQKRITLLSSQLEKAGADELVIQNQIEELRAADILSNGIKSLRQSGSILMLSGDWERDLQQTKAPNDQLRHVVLVFLKEKKVSSYQVSFLSFIH
jgi:hypothetical protein